MHPPLPAQPTMRITIVLGPFHSPPPAPAGAVEKRWSRMAHLFAAHGHQVTIVCRDHPDLPIESDIDGVRYVRVRGADRSHHTWIDVLRDFSYSRRVRQVLPPADVTLTNCFWLPRMLKSRGPYGAVDVHIARFPKGQMWLYKHAARISTVSSYIAECIESELPPEHKERVRWITNPVDTDVFRPAAEPGDPRRICYSGRVHPEKGVVKLAHAVRELRAEDPKWRLLVVGDLNVGRGGGGDRYRTQICEAVGCMSAVEFTGHVRDTEELAAHLQKCRYFVYPSLAAKGEACPVSPLEALAAGIPPIVSELPQFTDYIVPDQNGLVVPMKNSDGAHRLAQTIRELANDPERYDRLSKVAATSAQQFAYEAVVQRYLEDFHAMSTP